MTGVFCVIFPSVSKLPGQKVFILDCLCSGQYSLSAVTSHGRHTSSDHMQIVAQCARPLFVAMGVDTFRCNFRCKKLDYRRALFLGHLEESQDVILVPFVSIFVHEPLRKTL